MTLTDTGMRLEIDPEPVALWLLRNRPDDFRQPEDYYADLARETTRRIEVLTERLAAQLQAMYAAKAASTFSAQRKLWLPMIVAIAGFVGAFVLLIRWTSSGGYAGWIAFGLFAVATIGSVLTIFEYGPAQRRWTARREAAEELEEAFQDAVAELLREIILERAPEEKAWGAIFDSQFAPTLVGIGVDQAISSSSHAEIVQFITEHPTSAIGIAGPRGVGKSTLMQKLITGGKRDSIGVRIPAPKRYEPGALVRLIHSSVAQEILHPGAGLHAINDSTRGRRSLLRRVMIGFFFVAVAVGILVIWSNDNEHQASSDSSGWRVGTLTVVCIAAAGAWLGLVIRSLWLGLWALRPEVVLASSLAPSTRQELVRLARRELEYLRYTATAQSKSGVGLKLGIFDLSGEDQLNLAERQPSEADSVERLRQFLRELTRVADRRVVICLDELDKMDKPEDVVAVVNGIKDLFHIRRVHVLVSVSTDAMHSFAARGVLVRDVFDSAFDTVVEVRRLSPEESADLLSRRATDFSFPAMYFCHAWSGGHPRDLIRAARACVTYRAGTGQPVSLGTVVDEVLLNDVLAVLRATTEKLHSDAATSGLAPDVLAFRDLLLEEKGPLHGRIRSALQVADLPSIKGPATEATLIVQTIAPYLDLATLISEFFAAPRTPQQWKAAPVKEAVQQFATAQAVMSGHPAEATRAVQRAQTAVAAANGMASMV
jgi:Cdc6-like AAA superfamily ATPase